MTHLHSFTVTVIVTLGLMVLSPVSHVRAQTCGTTTCTKTSTTNHKTVVAVKDAVVAVPFPVLVPAAVFQYLPAVTPVVAVTPAVPVAPVVQQPVVQQPVAAQPAPSTANIDQLIKERLDVLLKDYQPTSDRQVSSFDSNGPPPLAFADNESSSNDKVANKAPKDANWILALKNACARCHQEGGTTKDGIVIFNKSGAFAPNVDERAIYESIKSGSMPKGLRLDPTAKQALLAPFE